jgi:ribosomal protein L11 methyltransferase
MPKHYYNLILPSANEEQTETWIALLNEFTELESVWQQESQTVVSYLRENQSIDALKAVLKSLEIPQYEIEEVEETNWNAVFESNFEPITILDKTWSVRASFHLPLATKNEIIIDPKMSFGTGHHATTKLVMTLMDEVQMDESFVFDYGSGTGILAIMAAMKNAQKVLAIDNEEWAYYNSIENAEINQVSERVEFKMATLESATEEGFLIPKEMQFDVIIANITKNVLKDSAEALRAFAKKDTILFLSGFYQEDLKEVSEKYQSVGFETEKWLEENNWIGLRMRFRS